MSRISAAARRELVASVGARCRHGTVDDKRRMLDEFDGGPGTTASMRSASSTRSMAGLAGGTVDDTRCTARPSARR